MNIRDLKYLIAVAEHKHFGKAAQQCFVSQPTLSGQIKKLEDELSVTLFERTNRSVEITSIGESILQHALQIIELTEGIHQLASFQSDVLAGPLKLGAILTISPYLMPLLLMPLKQQVPQMQLVLSEEMTDSLTARLLNHEIDAALLATEVNDSHLCSIALYDEPFWLAYPSDNPPSDSKIISQLDLENIDLLLLSDGHCLADQAMSICHLQRRNTRSELADLRAASLETLLQLVATGMGSTLVPALALAGSWTSNPNILYTQLKLPDAFRRISLVYRKSFPRPQAIEILAKIIQQHLPKTVNKL